MRFCILVMRKFPLIVLNPFFKRISSNKIVLVSKKVVAVSVYYLIILLIMSIWSSDHLKCVSLVIHIRVCLTLKI